MKNSRAKGKRGELNLAKTLTEFGMPARRGQQFKGTPESPDIIFIDQELNSQYHIECKRVETLNIEKAMRKASQDASPAQHPVVMHRKNGEDWKVTMWLEDWSELVLSLHQLTGQ